MNQIRLSLQLRYDEKHVDESVIGMKQVHSQHSFSDLLRRHVTLVHGTWQFVVVTTKLRLLAYLAAILSVSFIRHPVKQVEWRIGRRVAGLPLKGGNATYITATTDQLFDVPKKLDASEVSCMLSIYLPAFQALHHGQPRPWRYSQETLQRKRVLITGTSSALPETWAMVRLAQYGGASEVYVVCEREQHSTLRQHLYAIPLDVHMDDWLPSSSGKNGCSD